MTILDFWQLLAGLGLFLYGMHHLEDSMKQFDGRSFKLFLQKHTQKKISAIFSGTFFTGILQSSSIVNLMVLSFVGAGMLSMRNAMAVALGANVGGTFNSWLVAFLGFTVDLGAVTLPFIGIAGIGLILFKERKILLAISKFCMGIGLLFLGLDWMKMSMDSMIQTFDFTPYLNYSLIVFVIIGFVITAMIQTSAATVVLVLSALYAHIIPIETAVAVVLGAELGTTMKIGIGSIGGITDKKRVALGNIIFNLCTSFIGYVFLSQIVGLLINVVGIHDPIFVLVAFQTFINVLGILLFYFFLDSFGNFLDRRFVQEKKTATRFLQNTSPEIIDTAMDMLEKELGLFLYRVICINMEAFHLSANESLELQYGQYNDKTPFEKAILFQDQYLLVKQAEGELFAFYAKMSAYTTKQEHYIRLTRLMSAARNAMYAAKSIKDILENRKEWSNSINEGKFDQYKVFRSQQADFYDALITCFLKADAMVNIEGLLQLMRTAKQQYQDTMIAAYKNAGNNKFKDLDISTLFNVNRELYSSNKAIVRALKDYQLDVASAEEFDNAR